MKISADYIQGGNKGSIVIIEYAGNTSYIAVTAATSKTFKSLKGAEKFMTTRGYTKK